MCLNDAQGYAILGPTMLDRLVLKGQTNWDALHGVSSAGSAWAQRAAFGEDYPVQVVPATCSNRHLLQARGPTRAPLGGAGGGSHIHQNPAGMQTWKVKIKKIHATSISAWITKDRVPQWISRLGSKSW